VDELLFLVHRLPYPPNKGDKIRSFHIIDYLSARYRLYLGAFVDNTDDWQYAEALRSLCHETCFVTLNRKLASWRSLGGFLTGEPLTLTYYRDPRLQNWVDAVLGRGSVQRLVVYSSAMAQYVTRYLGSGLHSLMDFVDVDSDKWRQYSEKKIWPTKWLYRREYERLLRYERQIALCFDASVFVSSAEAELFKTLAPEARDRVSYINNGVDTTYFSPRASYPNPYAPAEKVLVFTGTMDYWANAEAVTWFGKDVFPQVLAAVPAARFYVVGADPTRTVRALARQPGIHITGTVTDVRPYLKHAWAAVAPMRIARGVQNKVLEAMAMAKPVLATSKAMASLKPDPRLLSLIADDEIALARRAIGLLREQEGLELGEISRQWVLKQHSWQTNLERFESLLRGNEAAPQLSDSQIKPGFIG
jgi:sugar transferase (PEP-CTERM/EpsH1 system associated)